MRLHRNGNRVLGLLVLAVATAVWPQALLGQAGPIFGSAPVVVKPSNSTPSTSDTFTVDLSIDLSAASGIGPAGPAAVALSAFRLPLTFDRARLELVSIAAGQSPAFSAFDATSLAAANANGAAIISASATGMPPTGMVSVATLTFRAKAAGPASIGASVATTSLASAIQTSGATLFGPAQIQPQPTGGGVVIQAPPALRVTATGGPSPVNSGGRVVYDFRVENTGGASAQEVVLTAMLPAGVTFLAASGTGTATESTVQWSTVDIAGGTAFDASLAVTVTATAPSTIAALSADATSSNTQNANGSSGTIDITTKATLKPGSLITMTAYGSGAGTLYDVSNGTPKLFGKIPTSGWGGALLFTPAGTLYAASNAYGGSIFDATSGGDLTAAAPIARRLQSGITGLARDNIGNLYVSSHVENGQVRRIAPDGTVTVLAPKFNVPGGLLSVATRST